MLEGFFSMSLSLSPGAFESFFPKGVLLTPGAFATIAIVVLFLVYLVWKAVSDEILSLMKDWLKAHRSSLLLSFLYLLPLLACVVTESYYAAGVMAVSAMVATILYATSKLTPRVRRLALVQLGVLLLAAGLQAKVTDFQESRRNKHLKVYLVLPVDSPGCGVKEVLDLSRSLHSEIGKIFGPDVQIQPAAYSKVDDLDQWKEVRVAVDRVWKDGLQTDLVLTNQANSDEHALNLLLGVKVHSPEADRGEFMDLDQILLLGRRETLKYLALRVCLEIVGKIKATPQALKPADEARIEKRILERYRDFLRLEGAGNPSAQRALEKTNRALATPALSAEQIRAVIANYPDEEAEFRLQRETGETKARSWRSRAGLDDLLTNGAAAERPAGGQG